MNYEQTIASRVKPIEWLAQGTEPAPDLTKIVEMERAAKLRYEKYGVVPTIGCEIEVKWSSLFPELASEFFGAPDEFGVYSGAYNSLSVEDHTSENFTEEVETIVEALEYMKQEGSSQVHVVAKSIGGACLAKAISSETFPVAVRKVTILGLAAKFTDLEAFVDTDLTIIQGMQDEYGDATKVRRLLDGAGVWGSVVEVPGTHSFNHPTTGEPVYQDRAISKIVVDKI